jgi:hypothetical protein
MKLTCPYKQSINVLMINLGHDDKVDGNIDGKIDDIINNTVDDINDYITFNSKGWYSTIFLSQ